MLSLMPNPLASMMWLIAYVHMAMFPIQTVQVKTSQAMSVVETLRLNHEVVQGFVCTSPSDIECIDDVCNEDGKYWTIEVNGDYAHVNSRTIVQPSDSLVLKYSFSRER